MKKFKKWDKQCIPDMGCVMSPEAKAFYRAFKGYLKRTFPNADLIGFKPNHYDTSGFLKADGKYIYISHSIDRYHESVDFSICGSRGVLYRLAKDEKDYKGGPNHFCSIYELEESVNAMLQDGEYGENTILQKKMRKQFSMQNNKETEKAGEQITIFDLIENLSA